MEIDPAFALQEAKDAIRRYYESDHDPLFCLDLARRNFEEVCQRSPDPTTILEALIGLSYTHGYLADIEASACTQHALSAVSTAERAFSHFQEHFQDDKSQEGRAYDALGCALRQRYVYLGVPEDCDRALTAERKAVELITSDDAPLARSVRRSHLIKALYMRSRGSSHDHSVHKQSMLEAVHMANTYECNGASTAFTPINGGLLYLCAKFLIDARSNAESEPSMNSSHSTPPLADGEPQSTETNLQRTIRVMELNYDIMLRIHGPRHTRVAAEIGIFGACLLRASTRDDENLDAGSGDPPYIPMEESFQIDLRYVPLLMDILHTLVTYSNGVLNSQTARLVDVICRHLHQIMPQTHIERPGLHYLLGTYLAGGQSGLDEKNITLAIKQFRKALGLTSGSRPTRDPDLLSHIFVQLSCLYASGSVDQRSEIETVLKELLAWTGALTILQSSNLDSVSRTKIDQMVAVLEQAQNVICTNPSNTPPRPASSGTSDSGSSLGVQVSFHRGSSTGESSHAWFIDSNQSATKTQTR